MRILHLANTSFEFELAEGSGKGLRALLRSTPVTKQLQYLPLVYAAQQDVIAVSDLPRQDADPRLVDLDEVLGPFDQVQLWGVTPSVMEWLARQGVDTAQPSVQKVRTVNSKRFSWENAPRMADSVLLAHRSDYDNYCKDKSGLFVLKSQYGVSGRGMTVLQADETLPRWVQQEWEQGRALIAEPWLERSHDFSTQWEIQPSGELQYLGVTRMLNKPHGAYEATVLGDTDPPFLNEHLVAARRILQRVSSEGYFGPIGVDALVYKTRSGSALYPVVELNARRSMARVALEVYQRRALQGAWRFQYGLSEHGELPPGASGRNWWLRRHCMHGQGFANV